MKPLLGIDARDCAHGLGYDSVGEGYADMCGASHDCAKVLLWQHLVLVQLCEHEWAGGLKMCISAGLLLVLLCSIFSAPALQEGSQSEHPLRVLLLSFLVTALLALL